MGKDLLKHIDRIILERPVYRYVLSSFRDIVRLIAGKAVKSEWPPVKDFLFHGKNQEGFPLFSRGSLPFDLEASSNLLEAILRMLHAIDGKSQKGFSTALKIVRKDPEWAKNILEAVLDRDETALMKISEESGLAPAGIGFLVKMALKPSLDHLRSLVSHKLGTANWKWGYCPLCGSEPHMARFSKKGARFLHCGLCGEEWRFPRLKCAFCNNSEQETLGYFTVDGEEGPRVDFCEKCRRYIKTIDEKALEKTTPLELEYLTTTHLDFLARENDFT